MTDREMLELAAKAAGVFMTRDEYPYSDPPSDDDFSTHFNEDGSITGRVVWYGSGGEVGGTDDLTWDPLNDDGDALRLAVKLGLSLHAYPDHHQGAQVVATYTRYVVETREYAESNGDDLNAATRLAITRAAAEIGKSMEGKNA